MDKTIFWIYLISVWTFNVNDLIRGHWFYNDVVQIIFWNIAGILALYCIIILYKKEIKLASKKL